MIQQKGKFSSVSEVCHLGFLKAAHMYYASQGWEMRHVAFSEPTQKIPSESAVFQLLIISVFPIALQVNVNFKMIRDD